MRRSIIPFLVFLLLLLSMTACRHSAANTELSPAFVVDASEPNSASAIDADAPVATPEASTDDPDSIPDPDSAELDDPDGLYITEVFEIELKDGQAFGGG